MTSTMSLTVESEEMIETTQCEIFCLIWLDSNPDIYQTRDAEQKLRSIINHLKIFQVARPCRKYIEQSSDKDRIVLIVSGQLGREIIPYIHDFRQVISVYVFCFNKKNHEKWAAEHPKVKTSGQILLYCL